MQRKTGITLLIFAALLATVFFLEHSPEAPPAERMTLPGFVPDGGVVAKNSTDLVDPGFTRILLKRPNETVEIVKQGELWKLVQPRKSTVEQFKVKQMLLPLQSPSQSLITQSVPAEDLRIYGLDASAAIHVSLFQGDALFTTFVAGGRQRSDTPDAPTELVDTWLGTAPANANENPGGMVVSRMGDKDLHTPFAIPLKDLRSKKLFSFPRESVKGITIANPRNPHPRISLKRQGEGKEASWSIVEPVGFEAGETAGLVGALVNLRAADFVPASDASPKGLDPTDEPAQITLEFTDAEPVTLRISTEQDNKRFASVEGSDEVVELAAYNANNLLKNLEDLRNKKVLGLQGSTIVSVEFESDDIALRKTKRGAWTMDKNTGMHVGATEVNDLLKDLEGWSVTDFSRVEKLSERGLDPASKPSLVTITEESGKVVRILVGDRVNQVHWAMSAEKDAPEMWKLTAFMARKLRDRTRDDFRNKQIFGLKREDIQQVTLKHAHETVTITPSKTEGESPWTVTRGDEVIATPNAGEISKAMTSLASLVAKSFVPRDPGPDTTGLDADAFTAEFTLADGTRHAVQLSSKSFTDNEVYARTSTASDWKGQLFTVNRFQAENIQRRFKHFQ